MYANKTVRPSNDKKISRSNDECGVGPPGSGKATVVRTLAKQHGCGVVDWQPPVPTLWHEHRHNVSALDQMWSSLDGALLMLCLSHGHGSTSRRSCAPYHIPGMPSQRLACSQPCSNPSDLACHIDTLHNRLPGYQGMTRLAVQEHHNAPLQQVRSPISRLPGHHIQLKQDTRGPACAADPA